MAARYLMRFGWSVVARNWRCRDGELDLICREPDGTVVVYMAPGGALLGFWPLVAVVSPYAPLLA